MGQVFRLPLNKVWRVGWDNNLKSFVEAVFHKKIYNIDTNILF
jgi:hypothetical protein